MSQAPWNPQEHERLQCVAVFDETHDVKTFVFAAPEGRRFDYLPGQFLTFELEIAGETVSRCYSLASSPLRPYTVSITVKRVANGPVSNWLHEYMQPGMSLRALGPMGAFSSALHGASKYLYVSGGSGVTPLMSMSRAAADRARPVDIVFLHAARTPADIVFRAELALMARRLKGFRVIHLPEDSGAEPEWAGPVGRVNAGLLRPLVPDIAERLVFCCGPAPFMQAVQAACGELGVAPDKYHQESFDFATLAAEDIDEPAPSVATSFSVTFAKTQRTIFVRADETVLKAAKAAGVALPSSCATGLCGTCKTRKVSGEVEMTHQGGIRKREIDAGLFLPCCSRPLSDLVLDR